MAEHWVKQTNRILRTMGCPNHLKVSLATFKFEGEAVNWWETTERAIPEDRAWHWEDFERRFFEKYFPRSYRDEKMSEFLKLTQGEMTIAHYADAIDKATRAENDDDRKSWARLQQHEAEKRLRTNPVMPPISDKRLRIASQQAGTTEDKKSRDSRPRCSYCQKLGHDIKNCYKKMRDEGCPVPSQKQPFGPSAPQKSQGRLYAMRSPEDADTTSGLIEGTATIQDIPIVLLFDCGATMSFISSSIVERLNLELKRTKETIIMALSLGKVVELSKYCENCPITIAGLVIPVNLVITNMKCFDVILGMDWMDETRATIEIRARRITFTAAGRSPITIQGRKREAPLKRIMSLEEVFVEQIPVVREFTRVFQEIPGLPPGREVDFGIDLMPGTAPIALAAFRMTPVELAELKKQLEELLNHGFIRPSVSPWGALVLFVKKKDGSLRLCIDYHHINHQQ
ncbi:uncharacterized protein LOC131244133 [Magnolia sinica]|uniref:uncharacterized protein LOC131244133 n=1 Tax=Magnolia sinica TaxID=86752 RepID=UPI00265991AE|nr:uncharacterized protein LOC131244133 [Magnolia sinica]